MKTLKNNDEALTANCPVSKINSYNEWSPLKEIIVGSSINYDSHELDLSFKIFFNDNAFSSFASPEYKKKSEMNLENKRKNQINTKYLEELNEDVEGLVSVLEGLGIKVLRPLPLKNPIEFQTPYWNATCIPALNVRDQAIILGDEILETSPQIRARYFENDLIKPVFYYYFKLGSKWTCMPKPIMTDNSFDISYVKNVNKDIITTQMVYEQNVSNFDIGHEIMLDGAQCLRFGKDIVINVSTNNHELGFQWLEQHLGSKFRLHKVYITDNHIDSIMLPLRPGTLMLRDSRYLCMLPKALQTWDIIYPPEPTTNNFPSYQEDQLLLTSKYIDSNVLSIDENTVIVNSLSPELIKILERNKFNVIPVQHRHRRIFGGGFHCFTLDTVRESKLEDYLS